MENHFLSNLMWLMVEDPRASMIIIADKIGINVFNAREGKYS